MQNHKHHMHLDAGEELMFGKGGRGETGRGGGEGGTLQNITPQWIWFVSLFHSREDFGRKRGCLLMAIASF